MATKTRPPRIDYTTDDRADERLSPAEQARFDQAQADFGESELSDREKAAIAGLESQFGDSESDIDGRRIDAASEAADRQESSAPQGSGFYQPTTGKDTSGKRPLTLKGVWKKAGPAGLITALVGGTAFIGGSMAGPMLLLFNLSENATEQNDSASVAKESRFMKTIKHMLKERGYKSKLGTKMGKISNKGLSKLSKKGVVPVNADGSKFDIGKSGYPDKQPSHYSIDGGKPLNKDELVDHLLQKGNEKQASKVFGRYGAFKMRFKSWVGKHIKNKFLRAFGLKRNGGLASKINKKLKISERFKNFKEKFPKFDPGEAGKKLTEKVNGKMNKAKKGGFIYLLVTATCLGVKVPGMVAVAVTAIQILPIVGVAFDTILTPSSKAKAAGFGSGFTAEEMDTVGTVLTERGTVEGSKNTEGSAVDSPILMASLGVIKNKQAISDFAPGYSMITSPIVQGAKTVGEKIEPLCNILLGTPAMYASMGAEAAMAAWSGGLSSLVSWIGKEVIKDQIGSWISGLVSGMLGPVFKGLAENDMLPKARFKDLGDALGVGLAAFFSSGGMAQMLPTLKTSQLAEFGEIQLANEDFQKRMDIASLSPFDTSSKYTFMGSIVHNMGNMMLANGTSDGSFISTLSNILKLPSFALSFSSTTHAKSTIFSGSYCDYGKEFQQDSNEGMPAVNIAGLPCTGITKGQASMSTEEAISIAEDEGWIDDSKDIPENATIEDMTKSGYLKEGTPLTEFIESCSNAKEGDYWSNMNSCTVPDSTSSATLDKTTTSASTGLKDENGNDISYTAEKEGVGETVDTISNKKLAAMSVLLLDFQVAQSMNGEDEDDGSEESTEGQQEEPSSTTTATGTPENVQNTGSGWTIKPNTDYSGIQCSAGSTDGGVYDATVDGGTSKIRVCSVTVGGSTATVNSLIVEKIKQMMEAAHAAGVNITAESDFRSSADQAALYAKNCPNGNCSVATAKPGSSQHERGLAVDWGLNGATLCFPNSTCPAGSNAGYDWLMANAKTYGFYKLDSEAWHFSTSGF